MVSCIFLKKDGATFSWVFSFLALLSENKLELKINTFFMQH